MIHWPCAFEIIPKSPNSRKEIERKQSQRHLEVLGALQELVPFSDQEKIGLDSTTIHKIIIKARSRDYQ